LISVSSSLSTDSSGETFSGLAVEKTRKRHHALRQRLQKRGTKNAKRRLKKLSGREKRFRKNTNYVISKRIVRDGPKPPIKLLPLKS